MEQRNKLCIVWIIEYFKFLIFVFLGASGPRVNAKVPIFDTRLKEQINKIVMKHNSIFIFL